MKRERETLSFFAFFLLSVFPSFLSFFFALLICFLHPPLQLLKRLKKRLFLL